MTDTTTTPEVPSWLNLDAVCPPELRARIAQCVTEGESLIPVIRPWAEAVGEVTRDFDDAAFAPDVGSPQGLEGDTIEAVMALSGFSALRDVVYYVAEGLLGVVEGDHLTATYRAELLAKFDERREAEA